MPMRIRTIKPEFYQSETMSQVSREVRDLAKGLINWSDDEGYFRTHPRLIAGAIYPFDIDGPEFVAQGLQDLAAIGFVHLFEGGVGFLPGFEDNQRINRATESKLKPKALVFIEPSLRPHTHLSESSVSPHGAISEPSLPEGKGREVEREVEREREAPSAVREVFEHWQAVMEKPKAVLDQKRRNAVQARLTEGRSVDDLKQAVNGCFVTPHNMGANDRGEKFNDLELICRNGPNVERFMANATSPPRPVAKPARGPTNPDFDFPTGALNASAV